MANETMGSVTQRAAQAIATARRGRRASAEDMAVAGLVAAPFAATFGIWLSWLTWWPNPVIWLAFALVLVAAGAWVAGYRMEGASQ